MERQPCVYLLASKRNGTLYTGVASNLVKRVWEHKHHAVEGFTEKYGIEILVWYEIYETDGICPWTGKGDQELEADIESQSY